MQPNYADRSLTTGGVTETADFGISVDDSSHIMSILREQIYSDRILAVLREYSANAWDAHRMAGKHDLPILVQLPTEDNLSLTIRDYGPGLSHEDVFRVYTQYGKSTKRFDNNAVGMLGIGCKSAFAYADQFTITSCHGGERRVYIASLDETDKGRMQHMHTEPCDDETGIEVKIAVRPSDVDEFVEKAQRLFVHMIPRPTLNVELPPPPAERTVLPNGFVDFVSETAAYAYQAGTWYAVMGCVPYRIRLDQLPLDVEDKGVHRCLSNLSGVLPFNIGELQISASREELRYSKQTKDAIVAKFTALIDDYVIHAIKLLESNTSLGFLRRCKARQLHKIGFDLPGEWEALTKAHVTVFGDVRASQLYFVRDGSVTNDVTVTGDIRLLIDDTGKALKGYELSPHDYVVRYNRNLVASMTDMDNVDYDEKAYLKPSKTPLNDIELARLEAQLKAALDAVQLDGIPTKKLSQLSWSNPRQPGSRTGTYNNKHRATMFQYNGHSIRKRTRGGYSANWDVVTRVPEDTDVFVVIEKFEPYSGFFEDYKSDAAIFNLLGVGGMPAVYAYKSTEKKPVEESQCTGTEYREWRKQMLETLRTPEMVGLVQWLRWITIAKGDSITDTIVTGLAKQLGAKHPLIDYLSMARTASKELPSGAKRDAVTAVAARLGLLPNAESDAWHAQNSIMRMYPLFKHYGLEALWEQGYWREDKAEAAAKRKAWRVYIKMMDVALSNVPAEEDVEDDTQQASA
jgi:hypothetical protein